jgi:hypothetical protein
MTSSWRKHLEELFVLIWSWLIEVLVSFIAAYVMFHGLILYGYNSKPVFDDIAYVSSNKKSPIKEADLRGIGIHTDEAVR